MLVPLVCHLTQSKSLRSCKGLRVYTLRGPLVPPRLSPLCASFIQFHSHWLCSLRQALCTDLACSPPGVAWSSPPAGLLPWTPLTAPHPPQTATSLPTLPPSSSHCTTYFFPICSFIFCLPPLGSKCLEEQRDWLQWGNRRGTNTSQCGALRSGQGGLLGRGSL